jgi:hypothetical protein
MDPVFLDALASKFNVITFDYSGIGLSRGREQLIMLYLWQKMSKMLLKV